MHGEIVKEGVAFTRIKTEYRFITGENIVEHALELILSHATHNSVGFQLLLLGLSVDSEELAEELLIQLQIWFLGDVLVFVHPSGVVNFDQFEINFILCLFETLLQEHLLADVIIEDIEPLFDIQNQILACELVEER